MTDSVGARLRQARELRQLTLEQASESTKLRIHYLQALENDDHSAIPSAAQARGFLRLYAEFLELDPTELVLPVAIASSPEPSAAEASPAPAAPPVAPSLRASLRQRLNRGAQKAPAEDLKSAREPATVPGLGADVKKNAGG